MSPPASKLPQQYFYNNNDYIQCEIDQDPLLIVVRDLGLEFESSHSTRGDPFGIKVGVHNAMIMWQTYYDDRLITQERGGITKGHRTDHSSSF